ncbi:MAG: hypothetical protein WC046_03890 [Candidatus Bathyarchaeia archaeon]
MFQSKTHKTGAPARGERTTKCNQLRIEEEFEENARYAGKNCNLGKQACFG